MNVSIRRILCVTDFSPPALRVQKYASSLADIVAAELCAWHVACDRLPVFGL